MNIWYRLINFLNNGRRKIKVFVFAFSILIIIALIVLNFYFYKKPKDTLNGNLPEVKNENSETIELRSIEGDIKKKSSLFQSLIEKNIPPKWIRVVIDNLKPYVDFRKIKGGTYKFVCDLKGNLVKFIYEISPVEIYEIEKNSNGYKTKRKEVVLDHYIVKIVGKINSSLFETMDGLGERDSLTIALSEILSSEIDFYKDVQDGDRFKIILEKIFKGDEFISYGDIYAFQYEKADHIVFGFRYKDDYYNEKGLSLRKSILKSPLRFTRISSKFSRARKHPILGGFYPHYGIDYAAPSGTPVRAVADGYIISCGWNGGFGKQVVIKHSNGYQTYYSHLSRFAKGIGKNKIIKQNQIIGFVGSTGLSTGPHLDYRMAKNGKFINPLKEKFPEGKSIKKEEMDSFLKIRGQMLTWLKGDEPFKKLIREKVSEKI